MVCAGRRLEHANVQILILAILLASFAVALVVQLNGGVGLANFSAGGSHDHGSSVNRKSSPVHRRTTREVMDYGSCRSRNESSSFLYRNEYPESNKSNPKPSAYLQAKLWKYEALHKRCAPHTRAFNNSVFLHKEEEKEDGDCKYLVWVTSSGLGNRMLSLTSCFLYALLTGRVLLISSGDNDMVELFCEPFPEGTWVLPSDFPLFKHNRDFHKSSPHRYGNYFMKNMNSSQPSSPLFVYQHMEHDYQVQDRSFFCEDDQLFLQRFPWVVVKSNLYFIPSLFLTPSFQDELNLLFPSKDGVFQLLSHYLLHPSNEVWGMIKRYYEAYLKQADERIGLQIRKLHSKLVPSDDLLKKITSCMSQEKLLPELQKDDDNITTTERRSRNKVVLVASLTSWYMEKLKSRYWMNPNINGDTISVHQPSHEEKQQTHLHSHNIKALAEIYLLSSADKLVTTAYSTFGYVPRALGGVVESWVLTRGWNASHPTSPPCRKVASSEPCHLSPPNFDCKARREKLNGEINPYIRRCIDTAPGAGYTLV